MELAPTCKCGCGIPVERQVNTPKWRAYALDHHLRPNRVADALTRVAVGAPDDCWPWLGRINPDGYGIAYLGRTDGVRRSTTAHRWVYSKMVGNVAPELEVDHLCHGVDETCPGGAACPHRRCCNPAHLEAVTPLVNTRRKAARQTHCKRGHPLSGDNLYLWRGVRICRACRRLSKHERVAS